MVNLTAIIPVRYNDALLPEKNILPFGKSNLLIHKIQQLKKTKGIDNIIVSSENDMILEMATNENVSILKRPPQYATPECDFGTFVKHTCESIESKHILWACVTSPLVDSTTYEYAISLYYEKMLTGYDSLITVQKIKRFLLDNNGPLNFRMHSDYKDTNKLPDLYVFTNGIVLAPRIDMIKWRYNWGHIPYKLELDKTSSIDICDYNDYCYAALAYKQIMQNEEQ